MFILIYCSVKWENMIFNWDRSTDRPIYRIRWKRDVVALKMLRRRMQLRNHMAKLFIFVSFFSQHWVNIFEFFFFFSYIYILNYIFFRCFSPSKFFLNFYNFHIVWIQSIFLATLIVFKFIISLNRTSDRIIITYFSF